MKRNDTFMFALSLMHCQVEERDAKISVWAQKPVKVVSSVVIGKDSVAHETRYNIMQPVGIFP